jgi:hypothetical protein
MRLFALERCNNGWVDMIYMDFPRWIGGLGRSDELYCALFGLS